MRLCQIRGGTAYLTPSVRVDRGRFCIERGCRMLATAMDVLEQFPVRKTKLQKQQFRNEIQRYGQNLGYRVTVKKGSFGSKNLIMGNPETAEYVVTAHYDTPARMFLPNFVTPCNIVIYLAYQFAVVFVLLAVALAVSYGICRLLHLQEQVLLVMYIVYLGLFALMMFGPSNPSNANDNTSGVVTVLEMAASMPQVHRSKVCFVLFDMEEVGLIGSASYRKMHKKQTQLQVILNLDCVGDGDEIVMFPTDKLKNRAAKLANIDRVCGKFGKKTLRLHRKGVAICPSDHKNFPYAVGIMAFHNKKGLGLYCNRIHTKRDVNLDPTNVNILRAALITLICQ